MDEIKVITDRVTVMRDGGYVGTLITKECTKDDIINMLAGGRCHVDITGFANDMHEVHTKQIKIPGGNSLGYFLNAA